VDSLLGIGAAGGKSGGTMGIPGMGGGGTASFGSSSRVDQEGAMLAKRLAAMRQERNARNVQATTAADAKSRQSAAAAPATLAANPAATMTSSSTSSLSSSSVRELTNSGTAATGTTAPSFKPGNPRRKGQSTKKKKGKK
jgi:hypothetical protein